MSANGTSEWRTLLYRRLNAISGVAAKDFAQLDTLVHSSKSLAAGDEPREASGTMAVVAQGWCCRNRLLSDGRRALLNLWLPGDMISLHPLGPGLTCQTSALNDCILVTISGAHYKDLCDASPALVDAFTAGERMDSQLLVNQTLRLGRLSAYERVAHLLLELWDRLTIVGLAEGERFETALTQNLMADLLGLTSVHINRTLARLREDSLVEVDRRRVTLLDVQRLAEVAEYEGISEPARKLIDA